ncbi:MULTISPECIES: hypothetical protein [Streptomyces]|uniref:hypothetical protein n=1 Tax=Streptomyces TaxID=1883 RepID=UPI0017A91A92|nr:hypothetical protein [Streptomyces murinus]
MEQSRAQVELIARVDKLIVRVPRPDARDTAFEDAPPDPMPGERPVTGTGRLRAEEACWPWLRLQGARRIEEFLDAGMPETTMSLILSDISDLTDLGALLPFGELRGLWLDGCPAAHGLERLSVLPVDAPLEYLALGGTPRPDGPPSEREDRPGILSLSHPYVRTPPHRST